VTVNATRAITTIDTIAIHCRFASAATEKLLNPRPFAAPAGDHTMPRCEIAT
jgi:hypothetical protein